MTFHFGDRVILIQYPDRGEYPDREDGDERNIPVGATGTVITNVLGEDDDLVRVDWDEDHENCGFSGTYEYTLYHDDGTETTYHNIWCVHKDALVLLTESNLANIDQKYIPVLRKIQSLNQRHKAGTLRIKKQKNRLAFLSTKKEPTLGELLKAKINNMGGV